MGTRVIVQPEPFVEPSEVPSAAGLDDNLVAAMIASATAQIDGPTGWVGRAFGPQTLEWVGFLHCTRLRLPCPPVIEVESVSFDDTDGNLVEIDHSNWRQDGDDILVPGWTSGRRYRIRYRAGYDDANPDSNGTGPLPPQVRQAVILLTQSMISAGAENLFLRSVEVPDVLTETYTVSDQADGVIKRHVSNLLQGLRVYFV